MSKQKAIVIGSGFAGLSAAAFLAKGGMEVTVLEKNSQVGGRCRMFHDQGFMFDMGPSWYWMPDVFERFFKCFNEDVNDYLNLVRLSPSYKVVWDKTDFWDIPSDKQELKSLLEHYEKGAGEKLDLFLTDAKYKYEVGMQKLVFNASSSAIDHLSKEVVTGMFKLQLFSSFRKHATKYFKHPKILALMEFPVLFLGATAKEIPALYSLMNYADIELGTWYPMGGMYEIVKSMKKLAEKQGVTFITDCAVSSVNLEGNTITSVVSEKGEFKADYILNTSDYHFFDTKVLPAKFRSYSDKTWDKKVLAPSSLIFYLGIDKVLPNLKHHNLFFDESMEVHSSEIYTNPKWPTKPLFYTCVPSKTDDSVAPKGKENLFILIPIASDLKDDALTHSKYFDYVIDKLEVFCGEKIKESILCKHIYSLDNFKQDYNAFKGNAYGLSNTLLQTAFLRPSIKSKKISNLYHAGQLTLPGPGVPPSLISGEIAALEILKN